MYVTILNGTTGAEVPGYGAKRSIAMKNFDDLRRPLLWKKVDKYMKHTSNDTINTLPLAGSAVRLRIHFRDATIFAVGA